MAPTEDIYERIATALDRSAVANEALIDFIRADREEDRELALKPGDALVCPHCGTPDPMTESPGGKGRMSEFVLATPCGSCGAAIYAIPTGYKIFGSQEEARRILEGR